MSFSEADYQILLARGLITQPARDIQFPRLPSAAAMAERHLLACVRQLALSTGWLFYHTHNSERSDPGFPDVVLCRPGALIFAELKDARRKPTEDQIVWLDVLQHSISGCEVYLWRPADWPAIEARLTAPMGSPHGT